MTKMNDDQLRQAFFLQPVIAINGHAIEWAKSRIEHLEKHACDMGELFKKTEEEIANLQSHLNDCNETIDRLECVIKLYHTAVLQKTDSTSQVSDEDRHQRHRRERMRDEVTLICVRDGIERMNAEPIAQHMWGHMSRDAAENICDGIDEFDAKQ